MQSATLSFEGRGWFNAALFRKNVTRFSPIWGVYTVLLFFALPMELIVMSGQGYARSALLESAREQVYSAIARTAVPMGIIFGLLVGMALFSYLMNNRAAGMLHSLPIRREGLFLTNWLSGLAFFLVPNLAIALITLCAQALAGVALPVEVLWWLLVQTAVCMFFFCLTVFCAMFTGHVLALPVFYGIVNILAYGAAALIDGALTTLLIGFSGSQLSASPLVRWCTPGYQLLNLLEYSTYYGNSTAVPTSQGFRMGTPAAAIAYCVVVGAVLTVLALEVYRRRQLERAGDLVTVGWVRPVFQYGLGICGGMTLGMILYMNFFNQFGPWTFIALAVGCAVVCAFAGRMMLKKTLRVFADGWRGCAVLAACLLILLGGAKMDLFGYQRWTPRADQVVSVSIRGIHSAPGDGGSYADFELIDPEQVARVVSIHTELVRHLDDMEREENRRSGGGYFYDADGFQIKQINYLNLSYYLADGRMVQRSYQYVPITAEALTDPNSYAAQIQALVNELELVKQAYLGRGVLNNVNSMDDIEAVGGWLTNADDEGAYQDLTLTGDQARKLWAAVREDMEAGRIGRRYLLDDREREENCYFTDLNFSLSWPIVRGDGSRTTGSTDLTITPQKTSSSTLKALEEMGLSEKLVVRNAGVEEEPASVAAAN